jgi:hypothetical protein
MGYTHEVATALRGLDMDESLPQELLPAPAGRPLPKVPQPGRKMLRSGSSALRRLTGMVGKSRQIYKVRGALSVGVGVGGCVGRTLSVWVCGRAGARGG